MYPMGMSAFILSSVQFVFVLDLCECIFPVSRAPAKWARL